MPYKVFHENGKSAVYAVDAAGKKIGKRRGLHDTPKDAQGQIAAIMANEKPKKEAVYISGGASPEDVEAAKQATLTVATSDTSDETETKDYYGDEVAYMSSYGGPLTFADLLAEEAAQEAASEMHELTYSFQRLASNIMGCPEIEDKAAALSALANEYAGLVGEKAKLEVDKAVKDKAIAQQIAGDNQPAKEKPVEESPEVDPEKSLFIWKEADTYRWLAAYSNNRRDDDNPPEIICSASHKEFDEALNKGEWPMPELWPWHIPFPVGVATFHAYDEESGFPIAGGYFYKGMEWAAEGMIEAGWDGTSHGMPSEWIQRDKEVPTVLVRHRTKEISPLPNWAAANKLAFFIINKESNMADEKGLPPHKRDEFVKAFGEERVKQIEATLTDKAKEADEAGIEKKEQTQAAQKEAEHKVHSQGSPVAEEKPLTQADLLKALEFVSDGIKTALGNLDTRLKAIEESQVEEKDKYDIVEILKAKSIIGNSAAKVHGNSALAKDAPKETEPEMPTLEATGGVPIGLVNGLYQLNQDYYSGGKR